MSEITELRGVECKVYKESSGMDGYVVHADREIGITIHSLDNDQPISCLNKAEILDVLERFDNRDHLYNVLTNSQSGYSLMDLMVGLVILCILFVFWGTIAYVLIHFIAKFW